MAETIIGSTDPKAVKLYSVSLHKEIERRSVFLRMMTEKSSSQAMAIAKTTAARTQTMPGMPIVVINDLTKMAGDKVTVDMFKIIGGYGVMGDQQLEGRGVPLSFSTMELSINQTRHAVAPGGKMTQQRTAHNLRNIARANLAQWFARRMDQVTQIHLAGARGSENSADWAVPLESHENFSDIMVNKVEAPTANRYFVAGNGDDVTAIGTADCLKLGDLDRLSTVLQEMPFPPAPIEVENDMMGDGDRPLWCLMVTPRQWYYILQEVGETGAVWRKSVADAAVRAQITKHPLFTGQTGIWNNIIIKMMPRAIRFNTGDTVKKASITDGAETSATVPSGITVDRAILVGGQALALARGDGSGSGEGFPTRWSEVLRDHGNSAEIAGAVMDGRKKIRFTGSDNAVTDFGVAVIDSYAPDPKSSAGATLVAALQS